ncbi:MAG: hypothetical protein ABJL99_01905 [Aliishimia sp.]
MSSEDVVKPATERLSQLLAEISATAHGRPRSVIVGPLDRLRLWHYDPELFLPISHDDAGAILALFDQMAAIKDSQ